MIRQRNPAVSGRVVLQEFGIARFQWLHTPPPDSSGVSVAVVSVRPGQEWTPHRHTGYEQFVYVLGGQGEQWVNGVSQPLRRGVCAYIPDGAVHALTSRGPGSLRFLAVYNPVPVSVDLPSPASPSLPSQDSPGLRDLVPRSHLQRIQDSLAEATGLGAMVLDDEGGCVTEPSGLPLFCRLVRAGSSTSCPSLHELRPRRGPTFFTCCSGITCVAVPILLEETFLGCVVCGFVLVGPAPREERERVAALAGRIGVDPGRLLEAYDQVPVVLNTPLRAAAVSLQTATSFLVDLAARESRERLLREYTERLARERESVRMLESKLAETRLRLLQAQLSPHFLFNSLNMIASSIAAGDPEPEKMVYALSDFLRYVLNHREGLVPLEEEIRCVTSYLTIQQGRFGPQMAVAVEVPRELRGLAVPSLLLQPLVENAIVHGLAPRDYRGRVRIAAWREGESLALEVSDDGVGIPNGTLVGAPHVSFSAPGRPGGLGLRMVRDKLEWHYAGRAELSLWSQPGAGTRVVVKMPARQAEEWTESAGGDPLDGTGSGRTGG
ncbi:MAG: PocR ligand-binding domain-containing protein [Bacillota bacterium]|nr:PocR ligand-binding domain-containing protein [Bacillota bacterium]